MRSLSQSSVPLCYSLHFTISSSQSFSLNMNEPIDKEPDELETIKEELRLYGDEAVSDSDSGWDLGREETL